MSQSANTDHVAAAGGAVPRRWFILLLLAATLAGAGLRLNHLGTGSVWIDEIFTIRSMHDFLTGDVVWTKVLGYVPNIAWALASGLDPRAIDPTDSAGWREAGFTEMAIRAPTVLIGIISVPILALASRRVIGDRGAVILALLLATAPWHIYWSQAARFYVLQFLFYSLALLFYFSSTRPLSRERFVAAITMTVLAFLAQPTSVVLGVIFAADWLLSILRRDPVRYGSFGWTAAITGAAVCGGLVALDAYLASGRYLVDALYDWPMQQSPAGIILGSIYLLWPTTCAVAGLGCLWLYRESPRAAIFLGVAVAFPILLFAALSSKYPVGSRYCFITLLPCLLLATSALDRMWAALRPRFGLALAATPLAAVLTSSLIATMIAYNSFGNLRARWREAVAFVDAQRQPGEPVYASAPLIASYYLGETALPLPPSPEAVAEIPHTAWFVVEAHSRGRTARFWLLPEAELVDFFSLRVSHTSSSVQVYRHTPPTAPAP